MSVLCHLLPVTKNVLYPLMMSSPHVNSTWIFRFSCVLPCTAAASAPAGAGGGSECLERSSGQACTCAQGEMEPAWKVKQGQMEGLLNIPSSTSLKSSVFFVKLSCYCSSLGNVSPVLFSAVTSNRWCVCSQSQAWPLGLFCSLAVTSLYQTWVKIPA